MKHKKPIYTILLESGNKPHPVLTVYDHFSGQKENYDKPVSEQKLSEIIYTYEAGDYNLFNGTPESLDKNLLLEQYKKTFGIPSYFLIGILILYGKKKSESGRYYVISRYVFRIIKNKMAYYTGKIVIENGYRNNGDGIGSADFLFLDNSYCDIEQTVAATEFGHDLIYAHYAIVKNVLHNVNSEFNISLQ